MCCWVDETSIRCRHRYVTVVACGDTGEVLAMIRGRTKGTLTRFFRSRSGLVRGVEIVVSDGSRSYQAAIHSTYRTRFMCSTVSMWPAGSPKDSPWCADRHNAAHPSSGPQHTNRTCSEHASRSSAGPTISATPTRSASTASSTLADVSVLRGTRFKSSTGSTKPTTLPGPTRRSDGSPIPTTPARSPNTTRSDDCHYRGGLLRMYYDTGFYGSLMVALNALPPDPEWAGSDWARLWEEHLEGSEPYILKWLRHQTDGAYWRNGSVGDVAERIRCPVFMIGGWRDGYPNPPVELYRRLTVPRKLLVGPWNHALPDVAVPGPRIDYLREVVRWLDHWCRGTDTGIMDDPPVVIYVQHSEPPVVDRLDSAGEWRAEAEWPHPAASSGRST